MSLGGLETRSLGSWDSEEQIGYGFVGGNMGQYSCKRVNSMGG